MTRPILVIGLVLSAAAAGAQVGPHTGSVSLNAVKTDPVKLEPIKPVDPPAEYILPKSGKVTVPAEGGILFEATIDGHGPYKMMLDTGSVNLLSAGFAREIGLRLEPAKARIAAGGGVMDAHPVRVGTLQIGDVTVRHEQFMTIDTPWQPGDPIGAVGYELLQNLAVTIDFEHQWLTFCDGPSFVYSGRGASLPLIKRGTNLEVAASLDGAAGSFLVDTGNEYGFSVESRFVRENNLIQRLGARYHGYSGRGYAGPLPDAYYARAGTLRIGDVLVKSLVAYLDTGGDGPEEYDGNIGQNILRQFNVTVDTAHGMLYLEKNGSWGKPEVFNRAGIILGPPQEGMMQQSPDLRAETVMTVLPGSPGEAAGVKVGDTVTAIDSRPPDDSSQESAFLQPPGQTVHLTVTRGGAVLRLDLVLRDIL